MRRAAVLLAIAALVAAPAAVLAAEPFVANLTADQEVPPATVPGGYAGAGSASVVISDDESQIEVEVTFDGLTGAPTGSHIHYGAAGSAGPVIFPLDHTGGSPINQTLTESDFVAPDPGMGPQTYAEALQAIRDEMTYVNVHTEANPPGELRGQIMELPDTATVDEGVTGTASAPLLLLVVVGLAVFLVSLRRFGLRRA